MNRTIEVYFSIKNFHYFKELNYVEPLWVEQSPLALQASARTGYAKAPCGVTYRIITIASF